MSRTNEELAEIARTVAVARGYPAWLDATVTVDTSQAHVLLSNPAYARGGGLLVILDPASGAVLDAIPQL